MGQRAGKRRASSARSRCCPSSRSWWRQVGRVPLLCLHPLRACCLHPSRPLRALSCAVPSPCSPNLWPPSCACPTPGLASHEAARHAPQDSAALLMAALKPCLAGRCVRPATLPLQILPPYLQRQGAGRTSSTRTINPRMLRSRSQPHAHSSPAPRLAACQLLSDVCCSASSSPALLAALLDADVVEYLFEVNACAALRGAVLCCAVLCCAALRCAALPPPPLRLTGHQARHQANLVL
jgi:hypothetical protein